MERNLQVLGKKCNVYELRLICECGGHYIADITDARNGKYIDNKYMVMHTCNECGKLAYVNDVYPKHTYHPYGEVIGFGYDTVI